ncbi:hypothetical protein ACPCZR_24665 [Bacillus bombysepticus]
MLTKEFREVLSLLDVLETKTITHKFYLDIHGYLKHVRYPEFRMNHYEKLKFGDLLFIDEIDYGEDYGANYGFVIEESDDDLITEQNFSKIEIEYVKAEPFTDYIHYGFVIEGEPEDIDVIADGNPFQVDLNIIGCLNTAPFWKQSLYLSYLMFKGNNILSSFMHIFITFEGLLRDHTSNTTSSIHRVYNIYTGDNLPNYLDAYRKIRNQVMHGNENIASELTMEDLKILIKTITELESNQRSYNLIYTTPAIDEGLLLP